MKLRRLMAMLLVVGGAAPFALAQSTFDRPGDTYVPRLGEIMNLIQVQHAKLWLAGQTQNWDLAAYELAQLRASLADAAVFYAGLPVSNVTTLSAPIQSMSDAVAAKDRRRFASAFGDLTAGCNACHGTMQRSFLVIRTPTEKPFGNQVFQPQGPK